MIEYITVAHCFLHRSPDSRDFALGQEIGTAIFLIKANASVHFSNGVWYGNKRGDGKKSWPKEEAVGYTVNAVDAKETLLDRNGFEDLIKLKDIKYLNLEGCPYVDDHCLASLVHIRDSLTHLNVNRCDSITENGLATLHKLRKLERLNMSDVPKVKYPKLVAAMLEEALPNLRVNIISQLVEKRMKKRERKEEAEKSQGIDSDLGQKQSVS
ncbi:Distal membrane-arm assembly complex protein 2 [Holothuria leucospilota]|uniref:Distal membrane-arm assembly complex protein 2 n=1 Tax=Holothuria leucospilota TaxID=206669 RepID=A0A9Q1HCI1_HOLLE|nr:Distal membrane-arm assembly complex protein 2 [Holothuria leucospilota]